ncbi:hypothetical protein [uncultured Paraglaciecola sp.]|uniref:hypothetical protein n=1 Tax=uncultured Paraglaciecola sp. TaxID=1765024 RepID=UPI002622A8F7|nr:hypothetical protein [uncultured Paraglaciecola sp.]
MITEDKKATRGRPSTRPKRKPVGMAHRLKFNNLDTDNFHYRQVNDEAGRVAMFKEGGYEIAPEGTAIDQSRLEGGVAADGMISVGNGTKAVLMRVPKPIYEEDQEAKQDIVDGQIEAIENSPESEGNYGKVTIK